MTRRHLSLTAAAVTALAAVAVTAALAVRWGGLPLGLEHDRRVFARVIAYNVQNLFDGTDHGLEYAEFRTSSGWDRGDYYDRLERTSEAIRRTAGGRLPDIVVLSEVESAWVAADLARDLLRPYRWVSGAPEPWRAARRERTSDIRDEASSAPGAARPGIRGGGAVLDATAYPPSPTRVVALSRRRPEVRTHRAVQVDLVPGAGARVRWRGREALELRFASRGLRLIAAHWKSQSGGERATEPLRILEASLVHDLLAVTADAEADYPATLLVGDLNEGLDEEKQHGGAWPTALAPWRASEAVPAGAEVQGADTSGSSPAAESGPAARIWFVEADTPGAVGATRAAPPGPVFRTLWDRSSFPGTYWYRGEWERLDHAFLLAPDEYDGRIEVGSWGALLNPDGTPARYDSRRGRGYSDHLPILVTLTRRPAP
ncbi:MAG: endonuclease/exonuclease/phosphatase family protein [Spirochaetota bacterium]